MQGVFRAGERPGRATPRVFFAAIAITSLISASAASAQIVAFDMVGSTSLNLTDYSNPWNGAFAAADDGFQKYERGVSASIPLNLLDDSLSIFPADDHGIIKEGNADEFFGAIDTENPQNSGPISATWTFDVSSAPAGLLLSVDMGAMGDFESSDFFEFSYSIDGGPTLVAFASSVDESGSLTYTLEGGAMVTLNDPMQMQGANLSNDLTTFLAALSGAGSELVLTLTAMLNGADEVIAFQNIVIEEAPLPPNTIAFDMVGSSSLNLTSYTNPWNGFFTAADDAFQKFQRGVSPSIPFNLLDDSLSIFPTDDHGIIKEGNTNEFFGAIDTENSQNSGPISATWVFDISGGTPPFDLTVDMGAMGDFESSDSFELTYSIDGGTEMTAFASSVDESGSLTYTLEGGTMVTLNDPMQMQGVNLSNDMAPFTAPLLGSGSELTVTLTAMMNGSDEVIAFQNLIVNEGSGPPPTPEVEIWEIQGNGSSSPYAGQVVLSKDNVVTALGVDGFFMQTPTARTDGDIDTSDGIFVFEGAPPTVAVGDRVDVQGAIEEFFGFTEFTDTPSVTSLGPGGILPAAVVFDATVPSPNPAAPSCAIEFECYEGMLIQIASGTVTGPNQSFGPDPFAEVHVVATAGRAYREPGVAYPGLGMPPIPTWDGNPEVFELDPNKLGLPNQIIPAGSTFSATGVLGFEFGGYELWPDSLTVNAVPLPVPVRPRAPGEMTVATLNLFRLFDDIDDPPSVRWDGGVRDDTVVSTEEYQRRLTKFSAHIREVLDSPDVLAVQEAEKIEVLQDLADKIQAEDPTVVYTPYLVEGNDLGTIDVGFLTRDHIEVDGVTQFGLLETYFNPVAGAEELLHDRPPFLIEARCRLQYGEYPVSVLVVHNRSLSGIEDPVDGPRVRAKRFAQAESVANVVQNEQTSNPTVRLAVTGDFNAFEFTDGYVDSIGIIRGDFDPAQNLICSTETCSDLVEPDLVNEVTNLAAADRYSFIFRGSAQVLDHTLTTTTLAAEVSGAEFGRGNVDAAEEYIEDGTTAGIVPLRSSDHDGFALFVQKDADNDGVPNNDDLCADTVIPESVPTVMLGRRHFALVDNDGIFDTTGDGGPDKRYTLKDTHGCSCEQIIDELGLSPMNTLYGCSLAALETWASMASE